MTQRNRYRTGRRTPHRRGAHKSTVGQGDQSSLTELSQQNADMKEQENDVLVQVETKSPTSSVAEHETIEVATRDVDNVQKVSTETEAELSETPPQEEPSSETPNTGTQDTEPSSETPNTEATNTEVVSKKSNVGKSFVTIAALAALIGGGYYYAKEHGLIGDVPAVPVAESTNGTDTAASATSTSDAGSTVDTESTASTSPAADTSTASDAVATETAQATADATATEATTEPVQATADTTATETTAESNQATAEATATEAATETTQATTTEPATETAQATATEPTQEAIDTSVNTTSTDTEETTAAVDVQHADVATLSTALKQQEQQIAQLTEQLKAAQEAMANQQAKAEQQQALRMTLDNLTKLFQTADFERSVRVSKENTLKALSVLSSTLALQQGEEWSDVRTALEQDIEAIKVAQDIDLDKLFAVTKELSALLKVAPFVSAESGQGVITPADTTTADETLSSSSSTSWLDKAVNQVEKFSGQAYEAIRSDLGGLIKVEKLSNPEVALMSVEQIQQQRTDTLRQLAIAQEALLKRQETVWKEAMQQVEQQLQTYYNVNVETVQQAIALAHQLAGTSVASQLPELSRTQQALEQIARQLRSTN